MGTLNVSQVAVNPELVGTVKMSLVSDLPTGFHINPLKRSNRVNVRLREEDASFLETMALELVCHCMLSLQISFTKMRQQKKPE